MSRTKPTEAEKRELEFPCPRCGVPAGEWCETGHYHWPRGPVHASGELHILRTNAALRAGRLPVEAQP